MNLFGIQLGNSPCEQSSARGSDSSAKTLLTGTNGLFPASEELRISYALIEQDNEITEYTTDRFSTQNNRDYSSLVSRILSNSQYARRFNGRQKINIKDDEMLAIYGKIVKVNKKSQEAQQAQQTQTESRRLFMEVVLAAKQARATDIHFCARRKSSAILLRINGEVIPFRKDIDYVTMLGYLAAIYNVDHDSRSNNLSSFSPQQSSYCTITMPAQHLKLRWQTFPRGQDDEFDVINRLIPQGVADNAMTLEQMGFLPDQVGMLTSFARTPIGGLFISGITGSGKSTTLRALMNIAKGDGTTKLYSVEDPIEGVIYGCTQRQIQRNEETKDNPFVTALHELLRADPDTIMVGEIRDHDVATVCSEAIRTGHQILTTVHANSAPGVLGRLSSSEIGILKETLAEPGFLTGIVYQKLLPTLCPHCKEPAAPHMAPAMKAALETKLRVNPASMYRTGPGCSHCSNGISGMTVCAEIMEPDFDLMEAIVSSNIASITKAWRNKRVSAFDDIGTMGKTAMEVALYKSTQGLIDPFRIEREFGAFSRHEIFGYGI